jgi:hypothetical protein
MKTFKIDTEPKIATGFITPENYFENFSSKVLLEINKEETKIVSLYSKRKIWFYAVAAVFVLGLTIPMYDYLENPLSKIDNISLENYIVYTSSISDDDFAYLLDDSDLENMNITLNIEDKIIENELTNSTDLEQYLLN